MIGELGHFALALGCILALAQSVLPLVGAHRADARLMALAAPLAVAQLIAACALVDAAAVAVAGASWAWVAACIVAYVLCRLFQKFIPGT